MVAAHPKNGIMYMKHARGVAGTQLAAAPRHGTQGLDAFQLQAPDPNRGCTGITVHDTKGQQFFTEEEER